MKNLGNTSKRKLTKAEGQEEQKFQINYDREIVSIKQVLNNKIIQLEKQVNADEELAKEKENAQEKLVELKLSWYRWRTLFNG